MLNVAEDHLDWYPDLASYAADKGRIYQRVQRACVYNVADPVTEDLVREADVQEGARAIGFTLGTPGVGMMGVVDDVLCDRAFVEERADQRSGALHARRPGHAGTALRRQRARGGGARPVPLRAHRGGPRGAARLPARRPPDRPRRRRTTGSPGSTTPRPPTRTPPWRPCRPTSRWSGWPVGSPRGALRRPRHPGARAAPRGGAARPRRARWSGRRFRDTRRMFR